ncbi:MAG: hypothetical protein DLM56_09610 [Pseudonocardiales bacterium]|nr:MAG: hypothetical protein DLM56_09610 [Pseudonocardiales bacterium]
MLVRDARLEVTRDGTWIVLWGEPRPVELPPDFYLREPAALDVEDIAAVTAFVGQWGRFGDHEHRDFGANANEVRRTFGWQAAQRRELYGNDLAAARFRSAGQLGVPVERRAFDLVHPIEVRYRAARLAQFGQTVLALRAGEPIAPLWQQLGERAQPSEDDALRTFAAEVSAAASVFHVRLDVGPTAELWQQPTGYSAGALQLLNDLAGDVPYRRCASETCGRVFTRQRGRSEYGQHRQTGVRFCSRSCARAQGERERRRRARHRDTTKGGHRG